MITYWLIRGSELGGGGGGGGEGRGRSTCRLSVKISTLSVVSKVSKLIIKNAS